MKIKGIRIEIYIQEIEDQQSAIEKFADALSTVADLFAKKYSATDDQENENENSETQQSDQDKSES